VLSRDGHGGDPLQKLSRHNHALVTERERHRARNAVHDVIPRAGWMVYGVATAARGPALQQTGLFAAGHLCRRNLTRGRPDFASGNTIGRAELSSPVSQVACACQRHPWPDAMPADAYCHPVCNSPV
jgi:hypothetical protein